MLEHVTKAIVLDKMDSGELDSWVYLYTEDFGKISAKAKSLRKITSKLAGHLEPSNLVMVRILDKNGPQLLDALTLEKGKSNLELLKNLLLVKELSAEWQPDSELWQLLKQYFRPTVKFLPDGAAILGLLGFDPAFAKCNYCQKEKPEAFYPPDLYFYCRDCSPPGAYYVNS